MSLLLRRRMIISQANQPNIMKGVQWHYYFYTMQTGTLTKSSSNNNLITTDLFDISEYAGKQITVNIGGTAIQNKQGLTYFDSSGAFISKAIINYNQNNITVPAGAKKAAAQLNADGLGTEVKEFIISYNGKTVGYSAPTEYV